MAPSMGSYKLGDSTFSSMIENYANSADFASVENLLSRIRLERRIIREHSFIVIFRAYGKSHLPTKAVELLLLDEMQSEGCSPNPVTYGLSKKGDLMRVTKLVDNMFLKGCVPNESGFAEVIGEVIDAAGSEETSDVNGESGLSEAVDVAGLEEMSDVDGESELGDVVDATAGLEEVSLSSSSNEKKVVVLLSTVIVILVVQVL